MEKLIIVFTTVFLISCASKKEVRKYQFEAEYWKDRYDTAQMLLDKADARFITTLTICENERNLCRELMQAVHNLNK